MRTDDVFVSFKPSEDQPCEPCNAERFDELLDAQLEEHCPGEPYEVVARCYIAPEVEGDSCWVTAIYHSNFEATSNGGCLGCDPATGECTTVIKESTTE